MAEEDTNDQCCLSQQTEQQNLFNPPLPPKVLVAYRAARR